MSDEARDLLVHGVAATEANDREEARFYLEWVLRIDPDLDQESEAWYYLSKITDDPVEKRKCLENVLAIYPNHGEARRDLAILEGRLKPEEIVDSRSEVRPLVPQSTVRPSEVRAYKCPKCGGRLTYDAAKGGLYCQFCGYTQTETSPAQDTTSYQKDNEEDWIAAMYSKRGHRWEVPTSRSLKCQNCGATVTLAPSQVSTVCPFCGAPKVIISEESRELLQPDGIVPFAFDANAALEHARGWLKRQRFRPDDLDDLAAFTLPRPIYLPFWTFDATCDVHWAGVVVTRDYGQVSKVPTSGVVPLMYYDLLIPGTQSVPARLLETLKFDESALVPYSPDLLAQWPAEIYSTSMSDAAVLAHEQVNSRARGEPLDSMADMGDLTSGFQVERTEISITTFKLVLLAVWLTDYTYQGQQFMVIVNGQSGEAAGDVPRGGIQKVLDGIFGGN